MTKLFSMKSLAFAGTAAFALTLAAAPVLSPLQIVRAEESTETTTDPENPDPENPDPDNPDPDNPDPENPDPDNPDPESPTETNINATIDYEKGILTVTGIKEEDFVSTDDGYGVFMGTAKTADKLGKAKYSLITDANGNASKGLKFDISGLLGKETILGISIKEDGTDAKQVPLTASSALKAKIDLENNDIKVTVGKGNETALSTYNTIVYQYKVGTYGEWSDLQINSDKNLENAIKDAKILGTTIFIRVADKKTDSNAANSPWSKEAKVKISAKAKAPKISAKTAGLKKAFEWKIGDKLEYIVTIGNKPNVQKSTWITGSKDKLGWAAILEAEDKNKGKLNVTDIVEGDAIASNVQIQMRTAGTDRKVASNISILPLIASKDSPIYNEVKVDVVTNEKRNATASSAAINVGTALPEGYTAQYSTDKGKAWKNVTKETTLERSKLGEGGTIQVRYVYTKDTKSVILPSAVTTITIPENGAIEKITATRKEAKDGKWTNVILNDYVNNTTASTGGSDNTDSGNEGDNGNDNTGDDTQHTHNWDEGEITQPATCTETGTKTYHCQEEGCNETKQETIDALGHSWVLDEDNNGKCEREGCTETCDHTELGAGETCETCGLSLPAATE